MINKNGKASLERVEAKAEAQEVEVPVALADEDVAVTPNRRLPRLKNCERGLLATFPTTGSPSR